MEEYENFAPLQIFVPNFQILPLILFHHFANKVRINGKLISQSVYYGQINKQNVFA